MKQLITAALTLVLTLALVPAEAATKKKVVKKKAAPTRTKAVTVNPLGLMFGLGNAVYEQAVGDKNSFTAGLSFASYGSDINRLSLFGVTGSYRWWFDDAQKVMRGWYAGPELSINTVNWSFKLLGTESNANATFFGGGAQGGYQWIFNSAFTLNLGLSVGYAAGSFSTNVVGAPTPGFGGSYVGGNLGLGYAF